MDLNKKVRTFMERNRTAIEKGKIDPAIRRQLERLSLQQGRLKKVLDQLIEQAFGDEGGQGR